jgi:hypothetical protein
MEKELDTEVGETLDRLDAANGDRPTIVPIGPALDFQVEHNIMHEGGLIEVSESRMRIPLEFPIQLDPLDPAVHMAWTFILSVFDPFQDSQPPTHWAEVVERMVEDALVEDYGTVYAE